MPVVRLLNLSAKVSGEEFEAIAGAVRVQLQRDVCPAWRLDPAQVTVLTGRPEGTDWLLTIQDGNEPDALGEHIDDGLPVAVVYADEVLGYGGGVLQPGSDPRLSPAVSMVVSHEACEMLGNPFCTLWSPAPGGNLQPTELCDRVQGLGGYDVGGVRVSDFVFPAGFLAGATGPYDYLGELASPTAIAPGGYMSVLNPDGAVTQVDAERAGYWRLRRPRRTSRSSRLKPPAQEGQAR